MESEFFGYVKGAFTGADSERGGFFHAANGGTLMLDEVADLPLAMQVKLLRALQERRVRKIGASREDLVDVRVVCASHKDWPPWWRRASSAGISTTASTCWNCACPRCASARKTCRCWRGPFSPTWPAATATRAPSGCRRRRSSGCRPTASRQRARIGEPAGAGLRASPRASTSTWPISGRWRQHGAPRPAGAARRPRPTMRRGRAARCGAGGSARAGARRPAHRTAGGTGAGAGADRVRVGRAGRRCDRRDRRARGLPDRPAGAAGGAGAQPDPAGAAADRLQPHGGGAAAGPELPPAALPHPATRHPRRRARGSGRGPSMRRTASRAPRYRDAPTRWPRGGTMAERRSGTCSPHCVPAPTAGWRRRAAWTRRISTSVPPACRSGWWCCTTSACRPGSSAAATSRPSSRTGSTPPAIPSSPPSTTCACRPTSRCARWRADPVRLLQCARTACRPVRFLRPGALQRFLHRHRDRGLRRPAVHGRPVRHGGRPGAGAAGSLPLGGRAGRSQRHRARTEDRSGPALRLGPAGRRGWPGAGAAALPHGEAGWQ